MVLSINYELRLRRAFKLIIKYKKSILLKYFYNHFFYAFCVKITVAY